MHSHMNSKQLDQLRNKLQLDKKQITEQMERLRELMHEDYDTRDQTLSLIDNHPADEATELYDAERDIGIYNHFSHTLHAIDQALDKLNKGEYGFCEVCHQPISIERLEAVPETIYCIEHAEQKDDQDKNFEQQIINFHELDMDTKDATFFDGEDTLQAVYSYGTSNLTEKHNVWENEFSEQFEHELHGYVEPLENFIATDITGSNVFIVRNEAYRHYIENDEGDTFLQLNDEDPLNP